MTMFVLSFYGMAYLWDKHEKFCDIIPKPSIICSCLIIICGGILGHGIHRNLMVTEEVDNLANIVLEKSNEYSKTANIDLSGKTVWETYNFLVSQNLIENNNENLEVVRRMSIDDNSKSPRFMAKNVTTGAYEFTPKIEN